MADSLLELQSSEASGLPKKSTRNSFTYDANGELILAWKGKKGTLVINDFSGDPKVAEKAQFPRYRFLGVNRFSDGRWLMTDARCRDEQKNATILSPDFQVQTRFCIGDAVEDLIIDRKGTIWVGYFDESGGKGLLQYSDQGEVLYDFNQSSGLNIFDLYAMTTNPRGHIFVYPYTDFYLARIVKGQAQVVLPTAPVAGARAITVGGNHVAFWGSYDRDDVFLWDMSTGQGVSVGLRFEGQKIQKAQIASYADNTALLWEGHVFRLHMSDLIEAAQQ